jgi:hypothetical protein
MIEGCQGCIDEAKPFIFRGPGPYRRDIIHDHPPEETIMTTPKDPGDEYTTSLSKVRKDTQDAIALDAKALGISFDPDYLTGEYPEVTPQLPTYYGPEAVPLSRQNLNWFEPAFLDVLTTHFMGSRFEGNSQYTLVCGGDECSREFADEQEWREHVWAELKARCIKAAGR